MLDNLSRIIIGVCLLFSVVDFLFVVLACLFVFLFWDLAEDYTLIADVDSYFLGFTDC